MLSAAVSKPTIISKQKIKLDTGGFDTPFAKNAQGYSTTVYPYAQFSSVSLTFARNQSADAPSRMR